VLALLAAAWFVLGAVQARDIDHATAAISAHPHPSARQAAQVTAWLDTASVLNPDRTVDLLRGQLDLARGRQAQAQRLMKAVTRAEPQNLNAWVALGRASSDNPRLFRAALARVRKLVPLSPGR
jgi:predicted Zn-dependent protease